MGESSNDLALDNQGTCDFLDIIQILNSICKCTEKSQAVVNLWLQTYRSYKGMKTKQKNIKNPFSSFRSFSLQIQNSKFSETDREVLEQPRKLKILLMKQRAISITLFGDPQKTGMKPTILHWNQISTAKCTCILGVILAEDALTALLLTQRCCSSSKELHLTTLRLYQESFLRLWSIGWTQFSVSFVLSSYIKPPRRKVGLLSSCPYL